MLRMITHLLLGIFPRSPFHPLANNLQILLHHFRTVVKQIPSLPHSRKLLSGFPSAFLLLL